MNWVRLVTVWVGLAALSAHAQYVPVDFSMQTFTAMNISAGSLLTAPSLKGRSATRSPPTSTVSQGRANVARELAQSAPPAERKAAEQTFAALLERYAAIEKQLGVEPGDVAGAMGCLIIGSYEGYRDVLVDPSHYQPVIRQLRSAMAGDAAFAKLSSSERRALYERMAILGMFVLELHQAARGDRAKAAKLREGAAGYLRGLQLDPASLSIGPSGLSLR